MFFARPREDRRDGEDKLARRISTASQPGGGFYPPTDVVSPVLRSEFVDQTMLGENDHRI